VSLDLYTMNENFIPDKVVDEFQSVIWTERYSRAGEVQLVVPAFPEYQEMFKEGTYLGLAGSSEIMELQTDSIENGLMTVVGKTLLKFLENRVHWTRTTDESQPIGDYTVEAKLGELIADRVEKMVITPVAFSGAAPWTDLNLDWARDKIDYLELGAIDHSGTVQRWTIPVGPLYTVLTDLAEKEGLGVSLYLDYADPELGYVLKFTTYRGVDRTSTNPDPNQLIRLTPNLETLTGLKEIRSIDGYKNVVYVNYQNKITTHYEDPDNIPTGFNRRVMIRDAEGEPVGHKVQNTAINLGDRRFYGGVYERVVVDEADIAAFREQNAKDALANNNYIRALDGQVSQNNEYKFGTHYGLGDILELESLTGLINQARVTEYIRSQDNTGVREYPTLSVISPT
jgi:hypothetical protein